MAQSLLVSFLSSRREHLTSHPQRLGLPGEQAAVGSLTCPAPEQDSRRDWLQGSALAAPPAPAVSAACHLLSRAHSQRFVLRSLAPSLFRVELSLSVI